ncbi:MAG: DVUA0089 family protein [Pseudomonadota bacterium]
MRWLQFTKRLMPQIYVSAVVAFLASPVGAIPASFTDIGAIGAPGVFTFDTSGSVQTPDSIAPGFDVDTELGIWSADGTLLAQDDDGGTGIFSQITIALGPGTYFFGISEFSSLFEANFVNASTAFETGEIGDLQLNVNGVLAGNAIAGSDGTTTATEETAFFRATVAVPLPATLPLVLAGLAGLAFMSRRKQI